MTRQPDDIEFVVRRAGDDPFGDKELRSTKGFTSQDIINAVNDVRTGAYATIANLALNPRDPIFGAKADVKRATDCVFFKDNPVVTCTTSNYFVPTDVNKKFVLVQGTGGTPDQPGSLITTIAAYISPTSVQLANAPITSGTNFAYWGTDDTAALQAWANAVTAMALWRPPANPNPVPADLHGICQGKFFVTATINFGSDNYRTDGPQILFGGRSNTEFIYVGPSCDDGSNGGAGGVYPNSNVGESVLRFKSCFQARILGGFTIFSPNIDIHPRVGVWFSAEHGGGKNDIDPIEVKSCVTAVHVGSALTVPAGKTYLNPGSAAVIPTGQHNSHQFFGLTTVNCIEGFRHVGVNTEQLHVYNFCNGGVVGYRGFEARGFTWEGGDATQGQPGFYFPGEDPDSCWMIDAQGTSLNSAAFVIRNVRQEVAQGVARIRHPDPTAFGGSGAAVAQLIIDGLNVASTAVATRTVTGSMDPGSATPYLVTGAGGSFTNRDPGKNITIPGAGAGGADLVTQVVTFISATQVYVKDPAQTLVSGVTITIVGPLNPLKMIDWRWYGSIDIRNTAFCQAGGYISVENLPANGAVNVNVENCSVPTSWSNNDPTTWVKVDASTGNAVGGVSVTTDNCMTIDALPPIRISSRKARTSSNDARKFATTIAAGSNGQVLPQATINVASTAGYVSGPILVMADKGAQWVTPTGFTGTTFTGCTGGSGTLATGGRVLQGTWQKLGIPTDVQSVSATYQVLYTDRSILCTANTFTVTLPAPIKGYRVRITNIGAGTITIATPSGTISGASSLADGHVTPTHAEYECFDGTNYVQTA